VAEIGTSGNPGWKRPEKAWESRVHLKRCLHPIRHFNPRALQKPACTPEVACTRGIRLDLKWAAINRESLNQIEGHVHIRRLVGALAFDDHIPFSGSTSKQKG